VVSSAAEAELGAAFQNAQKGAQFRNTLIELGYPQQPTTIFVDNTVAQGLATDTVNAKRSKSMDVRFFWLRDRIRKSQFYVKHIKGRFFHILVFGIIRPNRVVIDATIFHVVFIHHNKVNTIPIILY
jgi:hypothetical protein